MQLDSVAILIPSLEPDERLPKYIDSLMQAGFEHIVVVNDGSSASYDPIFNDIASRSGCVVLRHEVNRGKGQALRTGVEYLLKKTNLKGVITADADGQHTCPDTLALAERLTEGKRELLLGSRDFSSNNTNIPARSRSGNRITSSVFRVLYGHYLPDTQTGLRAFTRDVFAQMLEITGDRFEYEMNQLIYCAKHKIGFVVIPIATIYLDENKSSHFHPIRDSWRIYKLMLGSFLRFSAVSVISFLIDYAVLSLLYFLVFKNTPDVTPLGIIFSAKALYAAPIARICSSPVNFLLNKNFSFQVKNSRGAAGRYAILALVVLVITTLVFGLLDHFIAGSVPVLHVLLKAVIDVIMYILNYRIQQNWVFKTTGKADT